MLIKKETEYAILGLISLANNQEEYLEVRSIAEGDKLPETLLAKVFQKLSKAGLIESKTGIFGGFKLKKSPEDISLKDVIKSTQGSSILKCHAGEAPYCKRRGCTLHHVALELEGKIDEYLEKVRLKDLMG